MTIVAAVFFCILAITLVYPSRPSSLSQSFGQIDNESKKSSGAILKLIPVERLREFSYVQLQMAMPMRITVWCDSKELAETACKLAFDRAAELVMVFSDYDPKSETRRLTQRPAGESTQVSDDLFRVLAFSKTLNSRSQGAFDPTASPVIGLWRTARKSKTMPASEDIQARLSLVGFDKLQLADDQSVILLANGMNFDFGGIAKGYIGDQVISVLRENGIKIGCYEAGGDIVLSEAPPGTQGWTIDIGRNDDGTKKTLELENCGVSTSGDSQQFVEIGGQRYSHVIDPRTGIGVTTGRTAFVIAPSGMQSDSLATTGSVLNETEFQKVLDVYEHTKGWSAQNNTSR